MIARALVVLAALAALGNGSYGLVRAAKQAEPTPAPEVAPKKEDGPADVLRPQRPADAERLTPQHEDVIERLHRQGLARDPKVLTALQNHVRRYQAGELTRAAAAAQLDIWLRTWESAHPDRAASTRAAHAGDAG